MTRRVRLILASCGLLAASSLAAPAAMAKEPERIEVEGACTYADRLAPLIELQHSFAICDRFITLRDGERIELAFSYPSRLQSIEFRGAFVRPDRFEISAFRLREMPKWESAKGQCQFASPRREAAAVKCLASDGPRFFVVNFDPAS